MVILSERPKQTKDTPPSKVDQATSRAIERMREQLTCRGLEAVQLQQRIVQQARLTATLESALEYSQTSQRITQLLDFIDTRRLIDTLIVPDPFEQMRQREAALQRLVTPLSHQFWPELYQPDYMANDRRLCAEALEAAEHEPEAFEAFLTQRLRLPITHCAAVWQVLREGRWFLADRPLAYIRKAAKGLVARTEQPRRPRQSAPTSDDQDDQLIQPILTDGPTSTTIGQLFDPQDAATKHLFAVQALDAACRILHLTDDVRMMAHATILHEMPRRRLQTTLGWDVRRIERTWKAFSRARDALCTELKKIS